MRTPEFKYPVFENPILFAIAHLAFRKYLGFRECLDVGPGDVVGASKWETNIDDFSSRRTRRRAGITDYADTLADLLGDRRFHFACTSIRS
jgi:hypothetical protein